MKNVFGASPASGAETTSQSSCLPSPSSEQIVTLPQSSPAARQVNTYEPARMSLPAIYALLFLGQPIFAAGAGLSGSAVLRGIKGYLDNMSYATGVAAGTAGYTFTTQIMNAKAGIIQLSISKTSAFENATNNTPIVINGAGNESLVLTFV